MYKNVLNQYTIAPFLLFSSCFWTLKSYSQANSANSAATYANTDLRSDHPPSQTTTTAKPAEKDTTWTPVRRLWGYSFGDFYYNAHADATNRGAETMYNGVPTDRNAFQFRRVYLGYDYDIDQHFTAEVLLASEPNANTTVANATTANVQNGDN